jgi:hypothetical protein
VEYCEDITDHFADVNGVICTFYTLKNASKNLKKMHAAVISGNQKSTIMPLQA